jgi:hypothetical protein
MSKRIERRISVTISAPKLSDLRDLIEQLDAEGVPEDARVVRIKHEKPEALTPYPSYYTFEFEWTKVSRV